MKKIKAGKMEKSGMEKEARTKPFSDSVPGTLRICQVFYRYMPARAYFAANSRVHGYVSISEEDTDKRRTDRKSPHSAEQIMNLASSLYLCLIFGVLPLILHNGFLDISRTKTLTYTIGAFAFIFTALFFGSFPLKTEGGDFPEEILRILLLALSLETLLSTLLSESPALAWSGAEGRWNGAAVSLCLCLTSYLLLSLRPLREWHIWLFLGGSALVVVIGLTDYYGFSILNTLPAISKDQQHEYLSTIGQIDLFASFLSLGFPAAFLFSVLCRDRKKRILSRLICMLLLAGMAASTCESVLISLAVSGLLLPLFLISFKELSQLFLSLSALSLTIGLMEIAADIHAEYLAPFSGGLLPLFESPSSWILPALISLAGFFVSRRLSLKGKAFPSSPFRKVWGLFSLLALLSGGGLYLHFHPFDIAWGNYRGGIWMQGIRFFREAPLLRKLFGIGGDLLLPVFQDYFGADYRMVGGIMLYDNMHNEYLMTLISYGLFGFLLTVSILILLLYRAFLKWKACRPKTGELEISSDSGQEGLREDLIPALVLLSALSYLAQAAVGISIPVNSAILFGLLTALA